MRLTLEWYLDKYHCHGICEVWQNQITLALGQDD